VIAYPAVDHDLTKWFMFAGSDVPDLEPLALLGFARPAWQGRAACRGKDRDALFYSERRRGGGGQFVRTDPKAAVSRQ
jgi:hypothetical protein